MVQPYDISIISLVNNNKHKLVIQHQASALMRNGKFDTILQYKDAATNIAFYDLTKKFITKSQELKFRQR